MIEFVFFSVLGLLSIAVVSGIILLEMDRDDRRKRNS